MINNVKRPLLSRDIAFIGIGQAGGNIAKEFMDLRYTAFFINTSATDLSTIETKIEYKYQIPHAQGCSKNRKLAQEYTIEHIDDIEQLIRSKFATYTHIMFCFSMGGGTGSGMTPLLLKGLLKKMPEITFGIIAALPEANDSPTAKHNAVTCFREISSLIGLRNQYFIDNSKRNIGEKPISLKQLNQTFVKRMHDFLSITSADEKGNADESEVKTLLGMEGNVVFADIYSKDVSDKFNLPNIDLDKTLATTKKGCAYLAYSLTSEDDFMREQVEDMFGKPSDYFKGYNDKQSFVAAFGLPLPVDTVQALAKGVGEDMEVINSIEDEFVSIELPDLVNPSIRRRKNKQLSNEFSNLLDNFNF